MIWAILIIGLVGALMVIITSWIYKEMPSDETVSPLQRGDFIKGFREQFDTTERHADSDKK